MGNWVSNGNALIPNDPFLIAKTPGVVEPINIPVNGDSIRIVAHKLVHSSRLSRGELARLQVKGTLLNTQGFYVYRNKRLLIWGTWFGMAHRTDRTKLARIQIDVPNSLDHLWAIDIKKSQARPPEFIKPHLKNIIDTVSDISVRTYQARGRAPKDRTPFWDRKTLEEKFVKYEVNRNNPLLERFAAQLSHEQQILFGQVLNNLEVFLPIAQLQLDVQTDISIKNESEADDSKLHNLEELYEAFRGYGISKDNILRMEPFCYSREFLMAKRAQHDER